MDRGPMVQAGLLTAHPGSVHGDGEAPGDESSLRQGAGTGSPGSPDLETAAAAEQKGILRKRVLSSRVSSRDVTIGEGGQPGSPGAPPTWPRVGPRHQGA